MAGKQHVPTEETRKIVREAAKFGLPQRMMIALLNLDTCKSVETLTKHYRTELDLGEAEACAAVAGQLFKKCLDGDTTSIIFWHKTRMGFRETSDPAKQENNIPEPKEIIFTIKDARA